MNNRFDRAATLRFISQSKKNQLLALSILSVSDELQKSILEQFMHELKIGLDNSALTNLKQPSSWVIEINTSNNLTNPLKITNHRWNPAYTLNLCHDAKSGPSHLYYGLSDSRGACLQSSLANEINRKLLEYKPSNLPPSKVYSHWLYSVWVEEKYRNWLNLETLALLVADNQALIYFIDVFTNLMVTIESNEDLNKLLSDSQLDISSD